MPTLRDRLARAARGPARAASRRWRMHYFVDCCRLIQFATILEMRCGDRMTPAKRRALDRFPRAERSPRRAGERSRGARAASWPGAPETLGAELALLFALRLAAARWSRRPAAASARAGGCGSTRGRRTTLVPGPGAAAPSSVAVGTVADKIAPLELAVARRRPGAGQPPDPDDRPDALLRRLHRQAQPRPPARRARRARADRDRRPGRRRCRATGGGRSSPTAGSTGCSTGSRSRSAASRRASR